MMGNTIAEKILATKSSQPQDKIQPGLIVNATPDKVMSHDNAGLVIKQFKQIGVEKVWAPDHIVIPLDHRVPAESIKTANAHKSIREFVSQQGIKYFYDIFEGICHQVMLEKGHIHPGDLILGTDSHTTSYGCLAAFSTGIGATEMAVVWATGQIWLRIPESVRITIEGKLPVGVYAKDVILTIIGQLTVEGCDYKSVEFYGSTVKNMSISERFTLSNQTMEMGAKAAIVPFDKITEKYLRAELGQTEFTPVYADPDAKYLESYHFEADKMQPVVACPHNVDQVKPITELGKIPIHQAVLGSCTNGRLDDLEIAASILKGKKVAPSVRLLILPASKTILRQAMQQGLYGIFLEAGAILLNPGCGPCLGAHQGILADGERAITSTNRNFKGRMGSPESEVYLASPATVAASAVTGYITDPREFIKD